MLRGKAAIVTGSTSGIGLGIAGALAAEGCAVMLNGFGDADEIDKTRRSLEAEHGVPVRYSPADMSRPDQIGEMVRQTEAELGSVDVLVNNAGIQHVAPVEEFPPEKWEAIIAINLSAPFYATRAALPGMKARGWGRIVNIISTHGLVASEQKAAYVAAKHGLAGLTKVVALETAELDITCNGICPGWVRTPLVEAQIKARAEREGRPIEEAARDLLGEKQPALRFATPEEIGGFVVFLCGPHAVTITGAMLPIDGGWTAQ
jgi:3-hydroxybutyrate dehydrogenase